MRVLDVEGSERVLIVGHGQLGSAIGGVLRRQWAVEERAYPTDWSGAVAAARSVAAGIAQLPPADLPVTVVWAAGRCGMSSTADECRSSLDATTAVLEELQVLGPHATHLLGSVGALALGRPRWSETDATTNEAPYTRLKRDEESLVHELELGDPVVHLVSSVYGPPDRPGRRGMITALALNAAQLRATRIYGRWSTMRNYVHADDVGAFVAERIVHHDGAGRHVLAAHRSHTIAELVAAVASARRRAVPIHLVPADNADDLSIDPGAIAPGFRSRPLETAIRKLILDLRRVPVTREPTGSL